MNTYHRAVPPERWSPENYSGEFEFILPKLLPNSKCFVLNQSSLECCPIPRGYSEIFHRAIRIFHDDVYIHNVYIYI